MSSTNKFSMKNEPKNDGFTEVVDVISILIFVQELQPLDDSNALAFELFDDL